MALNLQLNRWQNMVMQEHVETISFARFVMEDAIAGQSSESWIIEILQHGRLSTSISGSLNLIYY